ncbi:hypothetical protein B0T14DRAFT_5767 [Immersiella caudata]|uniref:Transmembrane protein n=1 Tax=Immersiella caudata TaxID=314043 RepID=A0AA39XDC6_9PEZI|nr:hypothetical protein B0T14DRAFT_5767 [Immersiella caudata]
MEHAFPHAFRQLSIAMTSTDEELKFSVDFPGGLFANAHWDKEAIGWCILLIALAVSIFAVSLFCPHLLKPIEQHAEKCASHVHQQPKAIVVILSVFLAVTLPLIVVVIFIRVSGLAGGAEAFLGVDGTHYHGTRNKPDGPLVCSSHPNSSPVGRSF